MTLSRVFALCAVLLTASNVLAIDPPGWAVGKFRGMNPKYKKNVTVEIFRGGDVTIAVEGQKSQSGQWGSGGYSVSGLRFFVERGNSGIIVTQANDPSNKATYKYVGSGGWGGGGGTGGGGNVGNDTPPDYLRGFHSGGRNDYYRATIDLNVDSRGNASATIRFDDGKRQNQSGYYRDNRLFLNNVRFRTYELRGGFAIEQDDNSRNKTTWSKGGGGGGWTSGGGGGGVDAPDWIVGEFDGYNRHYDADINLTVRRDGYAVADVRFRNGKRQTQTGNYRNDRLTLSGVGFSVKKTGNGFTTEQLGDRNNWMEYTRHGSGGGGGGWGSWENAPGWMTGTFRGYNNLYDADVEITVAKGGEATVYVNYKDGRRQRQSGGYRNGRLRIEGIEFNVSKTWRGISVQQVGDSQNKAEYRRV